MNNDFNDLRGKLRPDYKPPKIPIKLEEVKKEKKHYPDVGFGWSDYWNVIKAAFNNEILAQLEGRSGLITTALSARYFLYAIAGIGIIFGILKLIS